MSFTTLGLSDAIVRAVTEAGYTQPTPIQTQAIPAVMNGGDRRDPRERRTDGRCEVRTQIPGQWCGPSASMESQEAL